MERRRFLKNVMTAAAVQAVAPGWLRAEVAVSDTSQRFARGLEQTKWLTGWKTVGRETLGPTAATLEGQWPAALQGTLYRNGPAWFDRAGIRYQHWFDGDGMVHAWRMSQGSVEHRARMVATRKFTREQQAGKFLVPVAGTTLPNVVAVRNPDELNTANTSVIRFGGRLFALWEAGSAHEIEPDTLETRGPVTWREDLVAAPFSAHPLLDQDGTLWNFGLMSFAGGGGGVLIWHIGADGRLKQIVPITADVPGYVHSFAMTRRHLIFMLIPFERPRPEGPFFENLRFTPQRPCRIAVVRKEALDAPRWFEVEYSMAYHFGDAYERGNEIVMRAVRQRDTETARSPMGAAMRGERRGPGLPTQLVSLRLPLTKGRAHWEAHDVSNLEFPTFDTRTDSTQPAILYAPLKVEPAHAPYFNAIAAIDPERGRVEFHRYGPGIMTEEHLFVPKPGSRRAGEGWLLGTLLDYEKQRSGIAVLDAERVADGPLAQAWVPYTAPLGFHGWFAPRA